MAFSTDSAWTISSDIRLLTLGNVYSRVQALDRLQDGSNNSPWRNPASSSIFTFVSHKICDCILVLQDAEKAKSQNGKKLPSSNSRNLELKPSKPTTGPRNSNQRQRPRTLTAEQDAACKPPCIGFSQVDFMCRLESLPKMLDPESENYAH
jgi:hypothetical protein